VARQNSINIALVGTVEIAHNHHRTWPAGDIGYKSMDEALAHFETGPNFIG
jgi:hypothetical protein